jgi:hypothetical protein
MKPKTLNICLYVRNCDQNDNKLRYITEVWAKDIQTRNELRKLLKKADNDYLEEAVTFNGKNFLRIMNLYEFMKDIRHHLENDFSGDEKRRINFYFLTSCRVYYFLSLLFDTGTGRTNGFGNYIIKITSKRCPKNTRDISYYSPTMDNIFAALNICFRELNNEFKGENDNTVSGHYVWDRDEYKGWNFNTTDYEMLSDREFIFDEGHYSLSKDKKVLIIKQRERIDSKDWYFNSIDCEQKGN